MQIYFLIAVRAGFSLPIILSKTQILAETIMKEERNSSSLAGRSMIALLVPSATAFIYDYDYDYCKNFINYLNHSLPGLTFLYFAGGVVIRFEDFVGQAKEDLFLLSYDVEVKKAGEPLVQRIRKGKLSATILFPAIFYSDWFMIRTSTFKQSPLLGLLVITFPWCK